MTPQELFIAANEALASVVDQIKDDQWQVMAPAEMSWQGPQSLRDLINYHAYDDKCMPDMLAGADKEAYGQPGEDLLGDDPKGNYHKYARSANAATKEFTELDKTLHLSYGDFPARDALMHVSVFRGLRSYDIAKLIGSGTKMDAALVKGLWDAIEPEAEALRQMGVFGPKVEVEAEASAQDRLLGLTGRHPAML